jgi:hypothetical protein
MKKQARKVTLVKGPLDPGAPARARYRVVEVDGSSIKLRILDADSPSFTADLSASFAANVRQARSENRLLRED